MSFNPCNIVLLCCCLDTVKIFDKKALGDDGVTLLVFHRFYGVPFRSTVRLFPTTNCLISLAEHVSV